MTQILDFKTKKVTNFLKGSPEYKRLQKMNNRLQDKFSYNDICQAMDYISHFGDKLSKIPTKNERERACKLLNSLETSNLNYKTMSESLPYKVACKLLSDYLHR